MLSAQSLQFLVKKNKRIYENYKRKPNLKSYFSLLKKGVIPRPQYALGLLMAGHQAFRLGYKRVSVIEFGCWNLEGLIDIEHHTNDIKKIIDIDFDIYGFDLGKGLPKYKFNKADRMYEWAHGDFKFKLKNNLKKLMKSKVIWGDVSKTLKLFIKENNFSKSPIGFIINDLDYHTSTFKSFDILKLNSINYIPRPILYFDDFFKSNEFEGEYFSIKKFNSNNKKKISDILEFAEQLSMSWNKWLFLGKRFKYLVDFNHPKYYSRYKDLFESTE